MVLSFTLLQCALALAVVVGLLARGRLYMGWSFGLYLVSFAAFGTLMGLLPDRFMTWPFWLASEATLATLKAALALELSALIFRAFPAAGRVGRFGLVAILFGTIAWIASANPGSLAEWVRVAPRAQCGGAFLFAWLLGVVLWYRIPLHPLHKAILMALTPYLLVFTVTMQALETFRWSGSDDVRFLYTLVFAAVLGSWLRPAWRREEVSDVHPSVAKTVQPWA